MALLVTPRHIPGTFLSPGSLESTSPEGWAERLWLFCPQLNRPKVNKIVEILEKAKSCYWPALQNVYMNVTQGEPDTIQEAAGPVREGWVDCLSLTLGEEAKTPREAPFPLAPFSTDLLVPYAQG